MANINLSTEAGERLETKLINGPTLAVLAILLVVLLVWGAIGLGKFYLDKKIAATESSYKTSYNQFLSGNAKEVADFQNRMNIAKESLKNNAIAADYFANVEKSILPGIYLSSLKYDNEGRTLALSCVASNYNDMAKQIFSFKQNDFFSSVTAGISTPSSTEGAAQINFPITLKLK